jgi:hypothetical protein
MSYTVGSLVKPVVASGPPARFHRRVARPAAVGRHRPGDGRRRWCVQVPVGRHRQILAHGARSRRAQSWVSGCCNNVTLIPRCAKRGERRYRGSSTHL